MPCHRYIVSGRVQGVWFRASTREQAERLNINGRASNLPDGRVEVLACGGKAALDELATWLRHGPDRARVDKLTCETVEESPPPGFHTG